MGYGDAYVEQMSLTRSPATPAATTMATNTNDYPIGNNWQNLPQGTPGVVASGDGLRLTSMLSVLVTCIANPSCTLSGGGNLVCWVWTAAQMWVRMPDLDLSLGWGGVTVQQARAWPALRNVSRLGSRILFLTSSVTVSSGTDVCVRLDGFRGNSPS